MSDVLHVLTFERLCALLIFARIKATNAKTLGQKTTESIFNVIFSFPFVYCFYFAFNIFGYYEEKKRFYCLNWVRGCAENDNHYSECELFSLSISLQCLMRPYFIFSTSVNSRHIRRNTLCRYHFD